MRRLALHSVRPQYPSASLSLGSGGLVVAELRTGRGGRVTSISILEAPDAEIRASVEGALRQWKFPMLELGEHGRAWPMARMLFYFVPSGPGYVFYPEEMRRWQEALAVSRRAAAGQMAIVRHISEEELVGIAAKGEIAIVDARPRESYRGKHRQGSLNIPFPELKARIGVEVPTASSVVVDCTFGVVWCKEAAAILGDEGFREVLILMPPVSEK